MHYYKCRWNYEYNRFKIRWHFITRSPQTGHHGMIQHPHGFHIQMVVSTLDSYMNPGIESDSHFKISSTSTTFIFDVLPQIRNLKHIVMPSCPVPQSLGPKSVTISYHIFFVISPEKGYKSHPSTFAQDEFRICFFSY